MKGRRTRWQKEEKPYPDAARLGTSDHTVVGVEHLSVPVGYVDSKMLCGRQRYIVIMPASCRAFQGTA